MTTFQRYLWFQVPGCLVEVAVLAVAVRWWGLPLWAAAGIFALLVIKDLVLYPFLRPGYEARARSGTEQLIGERGVVKQRLDPEGYVLVRGELWKARLRPGQPPLDAPARIRVCGAEGMSLSVEEAPSRASLR
jgi:membrane protein implicated in regulation of membrane protease activity